MRMNKVLALVVAAAMGLSSAAFAAETTATPAPAAARLQLPPQHQLKRFTTRNIIKPL
jgi:Spy/CpxP family protein refolding chaperone